MSNNFKWSPNTVQKPLIYQTSFTTSFIISLAGSILLLSSLNENNGNLQKAKLGRFLICIGWCLFSFSYLIQQFSKDARDSENAQPVQRLTTCNGQLQDQLLKITSNCNISYLEIIFLTINDNMPKTKAEILEEAIRDSERLRVIAHTITPAEREICVGMVRDFMKKIEEDRRANSPSTSIGSSSMESVQPTGAGK